MTFNKAPHIERLWSTTDGTTCILTTCEEPPVYSVTLVRDARVICERRLYGRASAQMLADGWGEAMGACGVTSKTAAMDRVRAPGLE